MALLAALVTVVLWVAFTTWAYALSSTTAGRMGATTYLVPPVAILLGWAMLGESPEAVAFLGGALCLVGVVIARRPSLPARGGRAASARPTAGNGLVTVPGRPSD